MMRGEGSRGVPEDEGARRVALEHDLRTQVGDIVSKGDVKLRDIAAMLDAEQFVRVEGKGARAFARFDFAGFIEREWQAGRHDIVMPQDVAHVERVILPPGEGGMKEGAGQETREQGKIPRTKYLIDVISALQLPYKVIQGENTPNMMREEPYSVFVISETKKLVFVNDAIGNATYVVYDVADPENDWELYADATKDELAASKDVVRVIYSDEASWKERLMALLKAAHAESAVERAVRTHEARGEYPKAQDNWFNPRELERAGLATYETLTKLAEPIRTAHPEWAEMAQRQGPATEFWSPEFIAEVKHALAERPPAPQGWMTFNQIVKLFKKDKRALGDAVETLAAAEVNWKKSISTSNSSLSTTFLPSLLPNCVSSFLRQKRLQRVG